MLTVCQRHQSRLITRSGFRVQEIVLHDVCVMFRSPVKLSIYAGGDRAPLLEPPVKSVCQTVSPRNRVLATQGGNRHVAEDQSPALAFSFLSANTPDLVGQCLLIC